MQEGFTRYAYRERIATIPFGRWLAANVLLIIIVFITGLSGCSAPATSPSGTSQLDTRASVGRVVSATFGPQKRLWRLVAQDERMLVDYSRDYGATFSNAVAVSQEPQDIQAKPEDRPAIAVDSTGTVYVTYFADDAVPWTTFFSYSTDQGRRFTKPVKISDHAETTLHYEDILKLDPIGRAHIFWHDERDKQAGDTSGAALYHTLFDKHKLPVLANKKVAGAMCDCCRIALDFNRYDRPVVFTRIVYPGNIRDHGILSPATDRSGWTTQRVTYDEWKIDACPEHGPALSIADGRYHLTWFTQGRERQGLFYAYSDDQGVSLNGLRPLGKANKLAGHADVLTSNNRVILAWQEFDGEKTSIVSIESSDRGGRWSEEKTRAVSMGETDYPFLLSDGESVFLSWNDADHGYQLIPLD